MAVLDIQVVASALTTIGTALHIAPSRLGWLQTGYLIAEVIAIPLSGFLTRALSLRWMFVSATLAFTLASLGCALSSSVSVLIGFRVVQGFCGGMLIPAVFTSIAVMIPKENETLATIMAGLFAMIAPTIGPFVGGYVTQHLSWNWIFAINIPPGLLVALVVGFCVRVGKPDRGILRKLDYATLVLVAIFLGTLQLLLQEAPSHYWRGTYITALTALCIFAAVLGVWRALTYASPFVDLRRFRRRNFSLACGLGFVLGAGLYASVYALDLFLGLVRGHPPLIIGEIMVVAGAAQLLMAPIAAWLETRIGCRRLLAAGFLLFGAGLFMNGLETLHTEFWGLFLPQVLRGSAVMLCILPLTKLALEGWDKSDVADASALFNLMRNLGGAIGIAMIDTVIETRTALHATDLGTRLQSGDAAAVRFVGISPAFIQNHIDSVGALPRILSPILQRAALTQSLNEGWLVLAALFALAVVSVPLIKS